MEIGGSVSARLSPNAATINNSRPRGAGSERIMSSTSTSDLRLKRNGGQKVTLLPDPEPRERLYTVISVDDHLVEPPHMFEGRMPARFAEQTPKVIELPDGSQRWELAGRQIPNVGLNASVGRPPEELNSEPARYEHMRKGAWDIDARIADMDIAGVYASLNFPSMLAGFAGQRIAKTKDQELGFAIFQAYNDWHLEEWAGPYPDRIIPCQLPWLSDPEIAASEIRRNVERGFKAVTFSENPEKLGYPSVHTTHWDPFFAACEETGTPVCLHIGSSSTTVSASSEAPFDEIGFLFFANAIVTAADWLYARIPLRFPKLKIVLSEGGIGWLPGFLDRIEHSARYQAFSDTWRGVTTPVLELFLESFRFCTIEDPTTFAVLDRIGADRVMVEVDYPHVDSTWPDVQPILATQLRGLDDDTIRKVTYENAASLFRHPVPAGVIKNGW
jgi:predicted TIM-barrel fold metal-dependent hydrolase